MPLIWVWVWSIDTNNQNLNILASSLFLVISVVVFIINYFKKRIPKSHVVTSFVFTTIFFVAQLLLRFIFIFYQIPESITFSSSLLKYLNLVFGLHSNPNVILVLIGTIFLNSIFIRSKSASKFLLIFIPIQFVVLIAESFVLPGISYSGIYWFLMTIFYEIVFLSLPFVLASFTSSRINFYIKLFLIYILCLIMSAILNYTMYYIKDNDPNTFNLKIDVYSYKIIEEKSTKEKWDDSVNNFKKYPVVYPTYIPPEGILNNDFLKSRNMYVVGYRCGEIPEFISISESVIPYSHRMLFENKFSYLSQNDKRNYELTINDKKAYIYASTNSSSGLREYNSVWLHEGRVFNLQTNELCMKGVNIANQTNNEKKDKLVISDIKKVAESMRSPN